MADLNAKVAVAVVARVRGQLLCGEPIIGSLAGFMVMPGGKIERGESIQDCAARELEEETGLVGKEFVLLDVVNVWFNNIMHVVVYLEVVTWTGSLRVMEPLKHKFWRFDDAWVLSGPCDMEFLRRNPQYV